MGCAGPVGPASLIAWARFPVRGPDGRVAGALGVADHVERGWSSRAIDVLRILPMWPQAKFAAVRPRTQAPAGQFQLPATHESVAGAEEKRPA